MERSGAHAKRGGIVYMGQQRTGWRLPQQMRGRHVHVEDMLGDRCVTGECHVNINGRGEITGHMPRHASPGIGDLTDVFTRVYASEDT